MVKLKAVSSQVDLPKLEEEVSQFWKDENIFQKSIENRDSENLFVFVDGPPFVTGNPHYGSLLPSVAKDVIPRYQTMLGKKVRRVWGWDCHGLPVENKVNQKLNIKSNQQLEEEFGIEKYIGECRAYVEGVTSDWRWYVDKIGRWVDMDNAYYTMDPKFMESVIWGFKQIYEKGLVYQGKRVSLYSTDTSTPVSNFEVAMDPDNYRDVEDLSIFPKFEIKDLPEILKLPETKGKKVYLLAWTTTPWTIPANSALAVNKDFTYSLVEYDNELFVLAKNRLQYAFNVEASEIDSNGDSIVQTIKEIKGKALAGISYVPIFDFFETEAGEKDFRVWLSDKVLNDEGTGVLHEAPSFGEVDFQMANEFGFSAFVHLDSEGKLTVGSWKGIYLRDASGLIAEDMEKRGNLFRSEAYVHRLPFYRGENPLIYMAQDAYFIDIQKVKKRMLELNQKINWIPKHIKNGQFIDAIETSPDWCISRNRYWATIMPIWKSKDGGEIVVGSIKEMADLTDQIEEKNGQYFFEGKPMDLHRDICDKIILKKDGKEYKRIPEVLDVWMDSGSVPFAEYHYPFENQTVFEKSRPADFIVEYTPQVRAWFNVLHRVSTILFDDIAFKTAISHGTIAGTDGRKMSKSYGNYPDPKLVLEKYGGDALRLYFMASPVMLGEDMNFSEEAVSENYRFLLIFWNCYKYFVDYASTFNWDGADINLDKERLKALDGWILSKLNKLILTVRENLDKYNIPEAVREMKSFMVEDYSTWYLRRSRDRISSSDDSSDRDLCLRVMYEVLVVFSKVAAPVIPFITEEIFKNLTGKNSIHLQDFPAFNSELINDELFIDMNLVRDIVVYGHAQRKLAGLKLRQPLAKLIYEVGFQLKPEFLKIIADELNVKEVEFRRDHQQNITVELDTNITPELKEEGEARELMRQVQQLRKEQNLTLSDKTKITTPSWPKKFEGQILKGTASVSIEKGEKLSIEKT